jgi:DNA recombination protein RmuC
MESWWLVLREQNSVLWLAILALCLLSFMLGWFVARLSSTRKISLLEAMLELELKSSEERVAGLEKSFSALSAVALRDNNQSFLQLASEVLGRHYSLADHGLQTRETAIENLVKPLQEALKTTHEQLDTLDKSTRQTQGELSGQIKAMSGAQALLHQETRHLAHALRRPEVRGQWGEITLRRLLELSGMNEHADFTEQASVQTEEGLIRPDLIVHLPANRQIVVDVKTPLDAYLDAFNCEDSAQREAKLSQHAGQLKKRIRELAQKQYWAQFEQAPDFVVLFIPGDQFLAAALDQQPELLDYALAKKVVLATPTSLVALLRVIAHGWQQSVLDERGKAVRELAAEFDKRLAAFSRHLAGVGRELSRTVETYNRTIGSYEHKVRPISRKFESFNPDIERVKVQSIETVVKEPKVRSE